MDLYKTEQLSEAIFQVVGAAIVVLDRDGNIVKFNPAAERITGFSFLELKDKPIWNYLIPPEATDGVKSVFKNLLHNKIEGIHENEWLIKDGGRRLFQWRNSVLRDGSGNVSHVVATGEDITDRVRATKELQQSEERFRSLVESSSDWVWQVDENAVYTYASPRIRDLLGYSPEEVLGLTPFDLMPPEEAKRVLGIFAPIVAKHAPIAPLENINLHKDGHFVTLETTGQPIFDADGEFRGYRGIDRDISERKIAEDKLRAHQDQLEKLVELRTQEVVRQKSLMETILNGIPGVVGYWDRDRINRFANTAYCKWFGLNPVDIQGKHIEEVFDKELYQNLQKPHVDAVLRGEPQHFTLTFPIPGMPNKVRHADIYYIPDHVGGEVVGYFNLALDVSELKHAKDKAESANYAKSAFLANMSHEIRTPLNAITGLAQIIHRSGLTPSQSNQMAKLEAASDHLLGIINAVLELSKIEAGKFDLEETNISVNALLSNVVSMLKDRVAGKSLKLITETNGIPSGLLGDPTRLQQALINYASNAIKFTERGQISLRIECIEETSDSALLRFEVKDTGIGIEVDALTRLFSAFEQADNTTTRKYGGTGLGLAITKKFAQMMGGDAGAESTLGVGSTFWFTARLKKDTGNTNITRIIEPGMAEETLKREFVGTRVLLAEDEPINLEIALYNLDDVGLVTDTAENGQKALELARKNDYALILMDMQMPEMDGLEATRQIRQLSRHIDTPIIAMTANAFVEDRMRCLEAGMNGFITKPVPRSKLYETLLAWLAKREE